MIDYTWVSMAAILRDWTEDLGYKNKEHQQLVDIADSLYNVGINPKEFKADYKDLYDKYGKEYFDKVLDDMRAMDSQLTSFDKAHELAVDYYDRVGNADYSEDWYGESYKKEASISRKDDYKVKQIDIMIADMEDDFYEAAKLRTSNSKTIDLDIGALELLRDYYS